MGITSKIGVQNRTIWAYMSTKNAREALIIPNSVLSIFYLSRSVSFCLPMPLHPIASGYHAQMAGQIPQPSCTRVHCLNQGNDLFPMLRCEPLHHFLQRQGALSFQSAGMTTPYTVPTGGHVRDAVRHPFPLVSIEWLGSNSDYSLRRYRNA